MNFSKIFTVLILATSPMIAEVSQTTTPPPLTSAVIFTPPEGWRVAEKNALPDSVEIMIVGTSNSNFPPSLNLGTEKFSGTLKDYLKKVKQINVAKGLQWKSLGTLQTLAGTASLSQVDSHTKWGEVRMMHVIIKHNDTIYILTGAALKEEFPKFYNDFFKAFKSLNP